MTMRFLTPVLLLIWLVSACGGQPASPAQPPESAQETVPASMPEATMGVETEAPDCLDGEISPVGQSIAEEYEFTSYEEVIAWFCNGAEFEDILTALETESQTGTPAEEMLQMLADGFSWEEVWQLVGLTD